jgi:hypothetical protein
LAQITSHDHANYHIKVKAVPLHSNRHRVKVEEHLYPYSTLVLDRVGGQQHTPDALPPRKKTFYPAYRRLRGPRGQSSGYGKPRAAWVRTPDPPTYSKLLYRLFDENHPVVLYQYLIYYKIPSRNTTSGMTNLDYSNMFWLILSHHQADIRMKQSGCPHNIYLQYKLYFDILILIDGTIYQYKNVKTNDLLILIDGTIYQYKNVKTKLIL